MSNLKVYAKTIEDEALEQINTLLSQDAFKDCKVRIMPDVHAGKGCVIGFTADLGEKVIPNIVGVDIGCGMLCVSIGRGDIDFEKLDNVIRTYVPSGRNVHDGRVMRFDELKDLYCYRELRDTKRIERSIGTLGGGNHFIEVDVAEDGYKYLVIHTGSRNLGKQVPDIEAE
jgi:tRNA-splicing ligase RtcB (3'-phosphate/5'-hydroxy nucleic acid ligase)